MTSSARVRRLLSAAIAAITLAYLGITPARAQEPSDQGWWTITNVSTIDDPGGLGVGGVPVGAETPPPPDVPEDGLFIQGGGDGSVDLSGGFGGPAAFAAVVYELPQGATSDVLTLELAPDATSTPLATVRLCPLANPTFVPAQGGSMSDAPEFDCSVETTAEPDESGEAYTFQISELISDGVLAVAVLPTAGGDRIVFARPGDDSLRAIGGDAASPADPATPVAGAPSASPGPSSSGGAFSAPAPASPFRAPDASPTVGESPSGQEQGATVAAPESLTPAAAVPAPFDDDVDPVVAVLVLLGFGTGATLWGLAGRERSTEPALRA